MNRSSGDPAPCPLCGAADPPVIAGTGATGYRDCSACGLISMHPRHYPRPADEKAHYDTHENSPSDPRYRRFLNRLAAPMIERLKPGARGLDYGSGPGPTLSVMLREAGFPTRIYDPFYAPETDALTGTYDFITCTETAEHFHAPARDFQRVDRLLVPGGWFGMMTEFPSMDTDFGTWWYRRDPTHVCFYREETLSWIARRFGWRWERAGRTVAIFQKPEDARRGPD